MSLHLKPLNRAGQSVNREAMVRGGALAMLMMVLGLGGMGCSSIYHQTQAKLPAEPLGQLEFRIKEAQHAEQLAGQSITRLRNQLDHGMSGEAIEPDVDRVVTSTFEFERRVASVLDAAAHCEGQTQLAREIERLQGRSKELQEYAQTLRRGGNSINARQLDDLLHGSAKL